jgi:hypothetical protein
VKRFRKGIHRIIVLFVANMMFPQSIQRSRQRGSSLSYDETVLFDILQQNMIVAILLRRAN